MSDDDDGCKFEDTLPFPLKPKKDVPCSLLASAIGEDCLSRGRDMAKESNDHAKNKERKKRERFFCTRKKNDDDKDALFLSSASF